MLSKLSTTLLILITFVTIGIVGCSGTLTPKDQMTSEANFEILESSFLISSKDGNFIRAIVDSVLEIYPNAEIIRSMDGVEFRLSDIEMNKLGKSKATYQCWCYTFDRHATIKKCFRTTFGAILYGIYIGFVYGGTSFGVCGG